MSAVDPERRIAVLNESIQSYRCCLINMKVVTEGSSIARMPERHGGWSESRRPFFDIQMAHYKHRGGKYHRQ